MHTGHTAGADCSRPFSSISGTPEGASSRDGRVVGTYVHGLFCDDRQRSAWLSRLGGTVSGLNYEANVDAILDRLAAHMEQHLDIDGLLKIAR